MRPFEKLLRPIHVKLLRICPSHLHYIFFPPHCCPHVTLPRALFCLHPPQEADHRTHSHTHTHTHTHTHIHTHTHTHSTWIRHPTRSGRMSTPNDETNAMDHGYLIALQVGDKWIQAAVIGIRQQASIPADLTCGTRDGDAQQ
ncbi:unnamed protein product [Arctogadus glacialis]